jgi:hypothetical protein
MIRWDKYSVSSENCFSYKTTFLKKRACWARADQVQFVPGVRSSKELKEANQTKTKQ